MCKKALCFGSLLVVLALFAGPAWCDLQSGLVAHWGFEGDFTDSAGTNDATPHGDAKIVEDAERGQVLELDGNGDYLEVPNSPSLNITGDKITLAAWVWHDDVSGNPEIIIAKVFNNTTHTSPYFSYGLHILTNGQPRVWLRLAGNVNAPGTTNLQSMKWHHLAGVYDGAQLRLYLDGVLVATNANASGNITGYNNVLRLGINGGLTEPMDGKMDDVRIYNRALSEMEVLSLATGISLEKAWKPVPADGALAVTMPLLQWNPGDGAMFHDVYLGTGPELTEADRVAQRSVLTMYYHAAGLAPGTTYYWRVDEILADMTTIHTGDVWSFIAQALTAYHPTPADGAVDAPVAPTLTWLPGQTAVEHHLYFGNNLDAVTQGTAATDKGVLKDAAFAPGELEAITTYYWRVDETVPGGAVRTGPVWSFTTVLPVEGFESYTDDEGNRIYETWVDGWTNNTGSQVGYDVAPFAERTIVHGGSQSMPLDYNNVNSPFYSEAQRAFAPVQDWTTGGADTLVLHVRGRTTNAAAPIYVSIMDASNRTGVAVHPDPQIAVTNKWTEWKIPLGELAAANVNLTRIKEMTIGEGDRANPAKGGAGRLYVDDIYLTRPAAAPAQ